MPKLEDIIRALVDRRTGVITSIDYVPPIPSGPDIHTYRAALATPYAFIDGELLREDISPIIVSGSGLKRDMALWSLIGEAVERYAAYNFDSGRTIKADYATVSDSAVDPDEWIGFDSETYTPDFAYQRYNSDDPIRWVQADDYLGGSQKLVPAVHVWLRLGSTLPSENFTQRASTGLGAGTNVAQAQLSGLLEIIERDAFACRWLISAHPKRLAKQSDISAFLSGSEFNSGIMADLYDISIENIVPVVLAKLSLPHREFGFCLGASAARSYTEASRKALLEAHHILQGMIFWQGRTTKEMSSQDIRDFVDHGRYYSQNSQAEAAMWFFECDEVQAPSIPDILEEESAEQAVKMIASRLSDLGYRTYFVNITPPDIEEIGFHVIKTLVPGMQPLTCGERIVADDCRRLGRVSRTLLNSIDFAVNRQLQPFA